MLLASVAPGVVVPVSGSFSIGSIGVTVGTVVVGTIANAPLVTVQGTVFTVGTISAQVTVGTITVGTVLSPVVVAGGTIGAAIQQQYYSTLIQTNAVLSASGAATLNMGSLQDLIADFVVGAAPAGSLLPWLADVEEQTGFQTGTIVSGGWLAGTVRSGHRLVGSGPVGRFVAVGWTLAAGGTVGVGTLTQVFITATPSESG